MLSLTYLFICGSTVIYGRFDEITCFSLDHDISVSCSGKKKEVVQLLEELDDLLYMNNTSGELKTGLVNQRDGIIQQMEEVERELKHVVQLLTEREKVTDKREEYLGERKKLCNDRKKLDDKKEELEKLN